MISKSEAVRLLTDKKYAAYEKDGLIIIESDDSKDFQRMGRILKKAGYNCSYGWKKKKTEIGEAEAERKDHQEHGNI